MTDAALDRANDAYDISVENRAELRAHIKTCEEQGRRNGERIEDANKKVDAVDRKVDALRDERREDRKGELAERQQRQAALDAQFEAIRQQFKEGREFQRRVGIAVVVAAIMLIGAVVGTGMKPFIGPAVEAAKLIGGK